MSDDDRMERAERIREMRQSREPASGDAEMADRDANEADEEAEDANGVTPGSDATAIAAGVEPVAVTDQDDDEGGVEEDSDGGSEAETVAIEGVDADETDPAAAPAGQPPAAGTDVGAGPTQPSTGGGLAPLGSGAGFSLSDTAEDGEDADGDERSAGAGPRATTAAAAAESSVRVLEFTVGEQTYCFDIERVEEIVKRETVTRVPNTPAYVEGVVDLRGQITTILDTKRLLDVEEAGREGLLVIFAPDAFEEHGSVGWVVDEVRQVVPVTDEQVRTPPSDDEYVRGIVDRDDGDDLVVWIRPGVAMSRAIEGETGDAAGEE